MYKRQVYNVVFNIINGTYLTGFCLAMGADANYVNIIVVIMSICNMFQLVSPLIFERLKPVSYTHLDVYKRQVAGYTSIWQASRVPLSRSINAAPAAICPPALCPPTDIFSAAMSYSSA